MHERKFSGFFLLIPTICCIFATRLRTADFDTHQLFMKMKEKLLTILLSMFCLPVVGQSILNNGTLKGDINGDGKVDVADITEIVNIIMGNSDNSDSSGAEAKDHRNWSEVMRLPSREEIDDYNSTSTNTSPYIGAWLDTGIGGYFTMFSIDFKADFTPSDTYCCLASFHLDYSSLTSQNCKVSLSTPNSSISGYAGLQRQNASPYRCNSIMSLWDVYCDCNTGETETIRAKLTKPVDAQESAYSHEGYGVHYLPDFPWEPHKWYRMLLRCTQSETTDNTTIEQWVFDISRNSWTKICVFDLGIPELTFTGKTCVFLENFDAKSSGEIRSLEFKNARVYNSESKSWSDIESAYFFIQEKENHPGSYQFGSDESTFWIITTGVPDCAGVQAPVTLTVKNTESGTPY